MADSKHTSIMANTWSTTLKTGSRKKRRVGNDIVEIQYGEYLFWYYFGRHAVDDNNNNRQGHLSFEEAYCAKRWDLRQLGFVFGLSMTDALLGFNYFARHKRKKEIVEKAEFQRELARYLIFNDDIVGMTEGNESPNIQVMRLRSHTTPKRLPEGCDWVCRRSTIARAGHELVRIKKGHGKWNGREFPKIKTDYSKCACSYKCGSLARTFCYCDFSLILCRQCYGEHIHSVQSTNTAV